MFSYSWMWAACLSALLCSYKHTNTDKLPRSWCIYGLGNQLGPLCPNSHCVSKSFRGSSQPNVVPSQQPSLAQGLGKRTTYALYWGRKWRVNGGVARANLEMKQLHQLPVHNKHVDGFSCSRVVGESVPNTCFEPAGQWPRKHCCLHSSNAVITTLLFRGQLFFMRQLMSLLWGCARHTINTLPVWETRTGYVVEPLLCGLRCRYLLYLPGSQMKGKLITRGWVSPSFTSAIFHSTWRKIA